jgi:hypothetical protein
MAKVIQLPLIRGDAALALDAEQILSDAAIELNELAEDARRYSPADFRQAVTAIVGAAFVRTTERLAGESGPGAAC